jgi:leucyl/phenylalanyl-tRNA---protein transferase
VELLSDAYAEQRLVDVQWRTDHLASLGVVSVPRAAYLRALKEALTLPLPDPWR